MKSNLDLPSEMARATQAQLELDYARFGQCRYERHENGYRRLSPFQNGGDDA